MWFTTLLLATVLARAIAEPIIASTKQSLEQRSCPDQFPVDCAGAEACFPSGGTAGCIGCVSQLVCNGGFGCTVSDLWANILALVAVTGS